MFAAINLLRNASKNSSLLVLKTSKKVVDLVYQFFLLNSLIELAMNKIIICFFIAIGLVFLNSCKKGKERLPLITTSTFQVGIVSAQVAGVLYEEGDSKVTEKGICWGTLQEVSIANNKVTSTTQEHAFTVGISGLEYNKTYFARAYAISDLGVSYGKVVSFKTLSNDLPNMTLSIPSSPKATSADVLLQLNQQTKATFTTGICWSSSPMPTVSNNTILVTERTHSNTVPFNNNYQKTFQNLDENTVYYFRGFCTNGISLVYSNQLTLTTANPITIVSLNALGITDASISSSITDINVAEITAVGICWSENQLPTIADSKKEQAYSFAGYMSYVDQLNPATTYYLRAYITTTVKTIYSSKIVIRTYKGTVVDIDGNSYYTVQIGNQEWMASNLRTTRYNNGATMQYVANYNQWVNSVNSQVPVYCYYNDQSSYNSTYGKLYPKYVATASNIAPVGWHVPTVTEWETLLTNNSITDLWNNGLGLNGNLTRLSLSAGGKWDNGYQELGQKGYFWAVPLTTTLGDNNSVIVNAGSTLVTWNQSGNGYSIRCVKD